MNDFPVEKFLIAASVMLARYVQEYHKENRCHLYAKLFDDLIIAADTNPCMLEKLFVSMAYMAPESIDKEVIAIQGMVGVLSRCSALRSLETFYNKATAGLKLRFINKYGRLLYGEAVKFKKEMIIELLVSIGYKPEEMCAANKLMLAKFEKNKDHRTDRKHHL